MSGEIQTGNIIEALAGVGVVKAPDARVFVVDPADTSYLIQDAIDDCIDDLGDVILCLPGSHNQTVGTIACNKQGITIIGSAFGHPPGERGESFMLRTASAVATVPGVTVTKPVRMVGIGITGRDITKESLLIDCGEAGGPNGGFNSFENCRFPAWYGVMDVFVRGVGGAVNYFDGCTFDGLFDGVATAGVQLEGDAGGIDSTFWSFVNCRFYGMGASKPAIKIKSGDTALALLVKSNVLLPGFTAANQGVMVDFNGSASTGMAADNYVAPLADQASAFLNTGSLVNFGFANNHYEEV